MWWCPRPSDKLCWGSVIGAQALVILRALRFSVGCSKGTTGVSIGVMLISAGTVMNVHPIKVHLIGHMPPCSNKQWEDPEEEISTCCVQWTILQNGQRLMLCQTRKQKRSKLPCWTV